MSRKPIEERLHKLLDSMQCMHETVDLTAARREDDDLVMAYVHGVIVDGFVGQFGEAGHEISMAVASTVASFLGSCTNRVSVLEMLVNAASGAMVLVPQLSDESIEALEGEFEKARHRKVLLDDFSESLDGAEGR